MFRKKPVVRRYFVLSQDNRISRERKAGALALALTVIGAPIAAIMWLMTKPTPHYRVALHLSDATVKTRDFSEHAFRRMAKQHFLNGGVRV